MPAPQSFTITSAAQDIFAASPGRRVVLLQHRSGDTVFFCFGGTAVLLKGFHLDPGGFVVFDQQDLVTRRISAVCASSAVITAQE